MHFKHLFDVVKKSVAAWIDDYAPSMGAAISYYTVFSIAPLLLIVIAVAGFVWGREAVQGEIVNQLSGLIGKEGATGIQALIESANKPAQGLIAAIISTIVLIIGATTVFAELQSSLDRIWQVPQQKKVSGLWATLRSRLLSFGFILGLGFLLSVSLVLSAGIAAMGTWAQGILPGWDAVLAVINIVVSVGIATVLFAMIFKVMPQAKIGWHDVWIGAFATAVLFEVGKWLIGLYIGKSSVTSSFAAAGSLVVLLVWVYYSAQIFLLGAEFTWVYAHDHGSLAEQGETAKAQPAEEPGRAPAHAIARESAPSSDELARAGMATASSLPSAAAVPGPVVPTAKPPHPTIKQRLIVYTGTTAAYFVLKMLLKRVSRRGPQVRRL